MENRAVIEFANANDGSSPCLTVDLLQPIRGLREVDCVTQVANATDVGSFLSALESARAGMQRGLRGITANAQKIAHASVDKDGHIADLSDALVQSLVHKAQVQLSARVLRGVDQTLGTLINVKA